MISTLIYNQVIHQILLKLINLDYYLGVTDFLIILLQELHCGISSKLKLNQLSDINIFYSIYFFFIDCLLVLYQILKGF